jgi:hypothetical protein
MWTPILILAACMAQQGLASSSDLVSLATKGDANALLEQIGTEPVDAPVKGLVPLVAAGAPLLVVKSRLH